MTKIDGHRHYDQEISHGQFDQATSDPMCQSYVAGLKYEFSPVLFQRFRWAKSNYSAYLLLFSLLILVSYMGQAQHFIISHFGLKLFCHFFLIFSHFIYYSKPVPQSDWSHLSGLSLNCSHRSKRFKMTDSLHKFVPLVRFPYHTFSNHINKYIKQYKISIKVTK
jgi:hypothetical protein